MSNILKKEVSSGSDVLTYSYDSVGSIDDIIIQLINESSKIGFLKCLIERRDGRLAYPIETRKSLSEYVPQQVGREKLIAVYRDLADILAFLEDSFIDMDYAVFDEECVFVDPANDKLYLIVIPVADAKDKRPPLSSLLTVILNKFGRGCPEEWQGELLYRIRSGIRDLDGLNELILFAEGGTDKVLSTVGSKVQESSGQTEDEKETKTADSVNEKTEAQPDASQESEAEKGTDKKQAPDQKAGKSEKTPEAAPGKEERKPAFLLRRKTGEIVPVTGDPFIIGKVPFVCDYVVNNNRTLSRIHAILRYSKEEEQYYIIDCNSTNHIYLDGKRIEDSEPVRLSDKIHIHLATEEFIFNCG